MKTKLTSFILLIALLALSACNLFSPNTTTHNVTLIVNRSYDINLGQGGDEQGVNIVVAPLNAAVSETYRDTVDYSVHYRYTPNLNYTGTDYVKLELLSYEIGDPWDSYMGVETEGYVVINFTIIGLED